MKRPVRAWVAAAIVMAVLGTVAMTAPNAIAASKYHFQIQTQPMDAVVGHTITGTKFDDSSNFVTVALLDASNQPVTNSPVNVTFTFASGSATGSLSVTPQPLVNGVATFGAGTLSIGTANEAQVTAYSLVPRNVNGPTITGAPSAGFDVWDQACSPACPISVKYGKDPKNPSQDDYSGTTGAFLAVSSVKVGNTDLPWLKCPGQMVIFSSTAFVSDSGVGTTSSLVTHVTKGDMKAAANNGQAHVEWCIALDSADPWTHNGASYTAVDLDGDTVPDVFVASAPACPNVPNPVDFAPCIAHQFGDGSGGSVTEGFITGDPTRRT
jgi:hypothetical protein